MPSFNFPCQNSLQNSALSNSLGLARISTFSYSSGFFLLIPSSRNLNEFSMMITFILTSCTGRLGFPTKMAGATWRTQLKPMTVEKTDLGAQVSKTMPKQFRVLYKGSRIFKFHRLRNNSFLSDVSIIRIEIFLPRPASAVRNLRNSAFRPVSTRRRLPWKKDDQKWRNGVLSARAYLWRLGEGIFFNWILYPTTSNLHSECDGSGHCSSQRTPQVHRTSKADEQFELEVFEPGRAVGSRGPKNWHAPKKGGEVAPAFAPFPGSTNSATGSDFGKRLHRPRLRTWNRRRRKEEESEAPGGNSGS
ncbi:unnamed protein product, partial [Nesidiocoris tenuis]